LYFEEDGEGAVVVGVVAFIIGEAVLYTSLDLFTEREFLPLTVVEEEEDGMLLIDEPFASGAPKEDLLLLPLRRNDFD